MEVLKSKAESTLLQAVKKLKAADSQHLDGFIEDITEKDFRLIIDAMGPGIVLVFSDTRVPRKVMEHFSYFDSSSVRKAEYTSEYTSEHISSNLASSLKSTILEYKNEPLHINFDDLRQKIVVPAGFAATKFRSSGGGWWNRPVEVPTEFQFKKERTEVLYDKQHARRTLLNSLDYIKSRISLKIYQTDLFLNSYKLNNEKAYKPFS